jgi:hypothetical protein
MSIIEPEQPEKKWYDPERIFSGTILFILLLPFLLPLFTVVYMHIVRMITILVALPFGGLGSTAEAVVGLTSIAVGLTLSILTNIYLWRQMRTRKSRSN